MSVKQHIACSWVVLLTSVDKRHIAIFVISVLLDA
jgi:hypothetical protein